jgi:hypothetical protein
MSAVDDDGPVRLEAPRDRIEDGAASKDELLRLGGHNEASHGTQQSKD